MNSAVENDALPDSVKASVAGSGLLANLKNVTNATASKTPDDSLRNLQQQVQQAIDDISQKLNSGKLDDSTSIKLSAIMLKLQGALHKSPSVLAAALSEAMSAIGGSGGGAGMSLQQKTEQMWQRVETDNKAINDDFEAMHEAGVTFNDKLWERHKKLMQDLQTHPRDMKTQKELDAVDDALLMQVQPQLGQYPGAQSFFNDAKKQSDDRHKTVDSDFAGVNKAIHSDISMADFDSDAPVSNDKLTMNDIAPQSVGQKSNENKFVRKQTNVCFRIKPNVNPAFSVSRKTRNRLICRYIYNDKSRAFWGSDRKSCSKVNVGLLHNGFV